MTGKNWIQLPAVVYATMIVTLTGIVVFGVEFFGDPATRTGNPAEFLVFNLPYVLVPLLESHPVSAAGWHRKRRSSTRLLRKSPIWPELAA